MDPDISSERRALLKRLDRYVRALERANEEHEHFAQIVSHDLRAPLRGLGQLTAWLREDLGDEIPPAAARHLDLLEGRVERIRYLVDDLLSYARAGHERTTPEPVDLGRLVEHVRDLLPMLGEAEVRTEGPMPTLLTPRVQLQTVLTNLIGNALVHGGTSVRVTVRAEAASSSTTRISVIDDGPGIPEGQAGRIFEVFQTLAPRDQLESAGLGLAIVKKIVTRLGGHVGVEATPGGGATFWFTWPTQLESTDLVGAATADLLAEVEDEAL